MAYDSDNQVLRLPKKHATGLDEQPAPELGQRLEAQQSIRNAVTAGVITLVVFAVLWVIVTALTERVFPWFTIVLGLALGHIVRLTGKGLDWRFPALAAVLTLLGAIAGNIVIAAAYTAGEFDTNIVTILTKATQMTWPIFFAEVLTGADYVYAIIAAAIAAFYAGRRLSRRQYFALRLWREANADD